MGKLKKGIEIWARNKKAKDEYEEELFRNLHKQKRDYKLNPLQLNEVLEDLNIPLF